MDHKFGFHREPVLRAPQFEDVTERLAFMQDAPARGRKAGLASWAGAAAAFGALVGVTLVFTLPADASGALIGGTIAGALFWPMVAVVVTVMWSDRPSQRTCVRVFAGTCLALTCVSGASAVAMRGYLQRWLIQHNMTAEDFRKQAGLCASARDLACEEASWRDYTRLRPNDAAGRLSLAMTLNRRNRNDEAVVEFRKALDRGEGSYELFAWYADSLARLGRTGEAIEWSYKALAALPSLVDVRGKLAGLLVGANRPYEALALLESYDAELEARGHSTYFMGQRGAIEAAIDGSGPDNTGEPAALRLPAYGGHYFAPVTLGKTRTATFMVDGGMEPMSISEAELAASRVGFRVTGRALRALSADGHEVPARAITIDRIRVGRFDLDNVQAVACASCPLVLGQSVLSQFDVQSTRVQGVEFLSFVKRGAREVASPATSPVASPRG